MDGDPNFAIITRFGMILEFLSFWLVAPEIIGIDRLNELLTWLQQLRTRVKDVTNSRWFGYGALALGLTLSAGIGANLADSSTTQSMPIWPGNWAPYLSGAPPLPVRASMAVGYSFFAMAMWYGFCEWWQTAPAEFKHIVRIGLVVGYALFTFGLGFLTIDLMSVFSARAAWWLSLVIAAWGMACLVFWMLFTFRLDRWWAWMAALFVYDIGTWVLLGYVSDGAKSAIGQMMIISVLGFNVLLVNWLIVIPAIEWFVSLVKSQPKLTKKLIIVGAATYIFSFVLQFIAV